MKKRKISILGAGLSGLSAAITLKKAGYDVVVYEKNIDVGGRFNGDIQGLENWSEKEDIVSEITRMGIKINFDCDPFDYITISDTKKSAKIRNRRPLFYLVKRGNKKGTIDKGLKEQAENLGVKIEFNRTIKPENADIIATGPIMSKIPGIDKGIVFDSKSKDISEMVLNDELALNGYSYLFITRGKGCMCTVVMNNPKEVNNCYEKTKEYFTKKYNINMKNVKGAGGVGCFSLERNYVSENRKNLYVGESAGLQDVLWGFGMRFALESGNLAAKSIIENEDYGKLAEQKFSRRIMAGMVNRYLWEKFDKKAYTFIIGHPRYTLKNLYRFHTYTFIQRIIYPFAKHYLKKKYPNL